MCRGGREGKNEGKMREGNDHDCGEGEEMPHESGKEEKKMVGKVLSL